jgi:hypothetical protein
MLPERDDVRTTDLHTDRTPCRLTLMLIGLDEFPFHQTTQTFGSTASSDPMWNDGHYICVADQAGTIALTSNLRLYPNNDVMDGFVCLRHEGRQYNVRVSRQLRPRFDELRVGPLRIDIIEPMQAVRLVLDDNPMGITVDITCESSVAPYLGPIEVQRVDGRLVSERMTYELTGTARGSVSVGDDEWVLSTTTTSMFRNHSWGLTPGRGGPRLHGAPTQRHRPSGIRQWVLFHLPEHGGFFFVDPSGRAAAGKGAILTSDRIVPVVDIDHDVSFYEGGRRLRSATFSLLDTDGVRRLYRADDLGWVYCQGGGYFGGFDDRLGQGVFRGVDHLEGEVWDVSHPTEIVDSTGHRTTLPNAWAENFTRITHVDETGAEHVGMAHYECVVFD